MNALILKVIPSIRMLAFTTETIGCPLLMTVKEFLNSSEVEDFRKFPFVKAEAGILTVDEQAIPMRIINDVKIKLFCMVRYTVYSS